VKKLIPVLIILGAYFFLRKGSSAKKLQYYFKNIKFSNNKLFLVIEIVNNSNVSLGIDNLIFDYYVVNSPVTSETDLSSLTDIEIIGNTTITKPFFIGKNGSTDLDIPIKLRGSGIVDVIVNMFATKKKPILLKGKVTSGGVTLPVTQILDLL